MKTFFKSNILRFCLIMTPVIAFTFPGCNDDGLEKGLGFVVHTGTFPDGGCEWAIIINSVEYYQPRNLPSALQIENLAVKVVYTKLSSVVDCPNANDYFGKINLVQIEAI